MKFIIIKSNMTFTLKTIFLGLLLVISLETASVAFAISPDPSNPGNNPLFQYVNPYAKNLSSSSNPQNFLFTKTLKLGSRDTQVRYLKKVLNLSSDTQLAVVGADSVGNETTYFNKTTLNAVMRFQKKYGLKVDGIIGEATRKKLTDANCNLNSPPSINIISPNGGEKYSAGDLVNVKWQYCNLPATSIVNVDIRNYNTDFTATFLGLQAGYILNNNQYTFQIPESANISPGSYKVVVTCIIDQPNNQCSSAGVSENTFTIDIPKAK